QHIFITPSSLCSYLPATSSSLYYLFFFNHPATTEIYTLSLHDALPIFSRSDARSGAESRRGRGDRDRTRRVVFPADRAAFGVRRSEEHTSELQSRENLVCRLLLEKKKKKIKGRYSETKNINKKKLM